MCPEVLADQTRKTSSYHKYWRNTCQIFGAARPVAVPLLTCIRSQDRNYVVHAPSPRKIFSRLICTVDILYSSITDSWRGCQHLPWGGNESGQCSFVCAASCWTIVTQATRGLKNHIDFLSEPWCSVVSIWLDALSWNHWNLEHMFKPTDNGNSHNDVILTSI